MSSSVAVDTNVLIYLHDNSNSIKKEVSQNILADNPCISSQVISEYLNVTRRLLNLSKDDLLIQTSDLFLGCPIITIQTHTLLHAAALLRQYNFQIFDAIIVAAAIEAQCTTLYSEDMHHGLLVDKRLTIINPFK